MKWIAFIALVAFSPTMSQGASALRWSALAVIIAWMVYRLPVMRWSPAHLALSAFLVMCALTGLWTDYPLDWVTGMGVWVLFAGCFAIAYEREDTHEMFVGAAYGLLVNLAVAFGQMNGYSFWGEFSPPGGTYSNRNVLSEIAVIVLVGLLAYGRNGLLWIPACVITLSWSRTALLALIAAGFVYLWQTQRKAAIGLVVLTLAATPLVIRHYPASVVERFEIWGVVAKQVTSLGAGVGSFAQNYPTISPGQTMSMRPDNVHNDYLEIAYEAGVVGLVLFLIFICTVVVARSPVRYPMAAAAVCAFFNFPFHLPTTVLLLGGMAGIGAADRYRRWLDLVCGRNDPQLRVVETENRSADAGSATVPLVASVSEGTGLCGGDARQERRNPNQRPELAASVREGAADRPLFIGLTRDLDRDTLRERQLERRARISGAA